MKLLQIVYDADTDSVVRAFLDGRDVAHEVTVSLAGNRRANESLDDPTGCISSPPDLSLSSIQSEIAAALGYQGDSA